MTLPLHKFFEQYKAHPAKALQACLDAAKELGPNIEVELIELAGLKIPGGVAAGIPLEPGQQDDFPKIEARMRESSVAGIIIGTPTSDSKRQLSVTDPDRRATRARRRLPHQGHDLHLGHPASQHRGHFPGQHL